MSWDTAKAERGEEEILSVHRGAARRYGNLLSSFKPKADSFVGQVRDASHLVNFRYEPPVVNVRQDRRVHGNTSSVKFSKEQYIQARCIW